MNVVLVKLVGSSCRFESDRNTIVLMMHQPNEQITIYCLWSLRTVSSIFKQRETMFRTTTTCLSPMCYDLAISVQTTTKQKDTLGMRAS